MHTSKADSTYERKGRFLSGKWLRVFHDYAFMSCGGSWQSLSSVKIHGKAAQSCTLNSPSCRLAPSAFLWVWKSWGKTWNSFNFCLKLLVSQNEFVNFTRAGLLNNGTGIMMLNNNKNIRQSIWVAISANFIYRSLLKYHSQINPEKTGNSADPSITNALKNFSGIYGILFQEKLCALPVEACMN